MVPFVYWLCPLGIFEGMLYPIQATGLDSVSLSIEIRHKLFMMATEIRIAQSGSFSIRLPSFPQECYGSK